MRKILLTTITCISALLGSMGYASAAGEGLTCDQNFSPQYLRYGKSYAFSDKYKNLNTYNHWLSSYDGTTFLADAAFNAGSAPAFDWTQELKDDPIIPGGVEKKVLRSTPYTILSVPAKRDSIADIFIKYNITGYDQRDGGWQGPISHTECQPYIITWCGDGIKDTPGTGDSWTAESCDDGADNGKPGKCNATCSGTVPPDVTPVCGDGKKEGSESCDDGVNNGKPGYCSTTCTGVTPPSPSCGSSIGTITGAITSSSPNLCTIGTVTGFDPSISGSTTNYTWSCNNTSGTASCRASYTDTTVTPICGNNKKEGTEQCDGTDGVPTGKQCSASCTLQDKTPVCGNAIKEGSESCDDGVNNGKPGYCSATCTVVDQNICHQTFTGVLRYGQKYSFSDRLTNNIDADIRLTNFRTKFVEQFDYNQSPNGPSFAWTQQIRDMGFIVPKATKDLTVIRSTNDYEVRAIPSVRSFDNLRIEYDIDYQVGSSPVAQHRECVNYAISWCGDGILDANVDTDLNTPGLQGEQCDPKDPNKTNWGAGGCDVVTCKPTSISPIHSGSISIKKYAKDIQSGDSQSDATAVSISPGETFNYIFKVRVSSGSVKGAIVQDKFPRYVTLERVSVAPAGWTCATDKHDGRDTLKCETSDVIPDGTTLDFTIVAKLKSDTPSGQTFQNIAYVCAKEIPNGNGGMKPNPDCTPPPPPEEGCPPLPPDQQKDPACITPVDSSGFDLSIKKYINSEDAESAIHLSTNGTFDYILKVKNEGPAKVRGTTFVTDTLPAGVERTTTALVTNGWTCTMNDRALSCNLIRDIASGAEFPEIRIPVRITATGTTTVTNEACVSNDNEKEGKKKGQDPRNCDKAVFDVTEVCTSGCGNPLQCTSISVANSKVTCEGNGQTRSIGIDIDGNGTIDAVQNGLSVAQFDLPGVGSYSAKCIVSSASTFPMAIGSNWSAQWSSYSSFIDTNSSCQAKVTTVCTNPNGCDPIDPTNKCGDGVVQVDLGEQCDPGRGYIKGCDASCKFATTEIETQPDTYDLPFVTIIPKGSPNNKEMNFGRGKTLTYVNGTQKIFEPYKLIVGQGTPVFREGDRLVLRSPGYVFVAGPQTQFGIRANNGPIAATSTLDFPIAGKCIGNFEEYTSVPAPDSSNAVSIIDPNNPTQRIWKSCEPLSVLIDRGNQNNFSGSTAPITSREGFAETNNATSDNNYTPVPMYNFYATLVEGNTEYLRDPMQVRVTRAILANNAGGAGYFGSTSALDANQNNGIREDDGFVSMEEIAAGFLETLKRSNFNAGTNTGAQATSTGFTLDKIVRSTDNQLNDGSWSTSRLTLIRHYGDKSIGNAGLSTVFSVNGKKTIVVSGRLTINQNIEADSSVAFIADEIHIGANVTRLDGVYIANKITGAPAGSQLIVNGSLYGDAMSGKDGGRVGIVPARTYARGSSASQGIVTGILINYSSRVLSDPPPLVSDFLSQYALTKVTSVQ